MNSPIHCEIDLEADGLHAGYLRLPHSVHRSAYGFIPMPIVSVRNGNGPTVLLMAGNHGDEYEGQVALGNLARQIDPSLVNGQIIILPMANTPAARAGLRTSPIDQGNLNRSFPGDPAGSPTRIIAHYIESELLKRADYLLDIHSGGSSMRYRPTVLFAVDGEASKHDLDLVRSLGFGQALLFAGDGASWYSTSAARRSGAIGITLEVAGGGNVDIPGLGALEAGLPHYLVTTGVMAASGETEQLADTRLFRIRDVANYLFSEHDGLFEPLAMLGQVVKPGTPAARIHFPEQPLRDPVILEFACHGEVMCERVPARVVHGDCLYEVGEPR